MKKETREATKEKIIKAIRKNFKIKNEDFVEDTNWGFIELSIDQEFDTHKEFGEILSEILNKIFPDNKNPIVVNDCDTIDDILNNNFSFKGE